MKAKLLEADRVGTLFSTYFASPLKEEKRVALEEEGFSDNEEKLGEFTNCTQPEEK